MYQPIVLRGTTNLVARDSLLFAFCGRCEHAVTWTPLGGGRFKAFHCGIVYEAEPIDIDVSTFAVSGRAVTEHGNVVSIFKKRPEKMVFA